MHAPRLNTTSAAARIPMSKALRLFVESALAAVPLVVSLLLIALQRFDEEAVQTLVFVFVVCAAALLILYTLTNLRWTRLASWAVIAGFVLWYAYPAFLSYFLQSFYMPDPRVYGFVSQETVVWSIAYLSLFLLSATVVAVLFARPEPLQIHQLDTV